MDTERSSLLASAAVVGVCLLLGLVLGGWVLGSQIKDIKLADRYVTVKGLVERTVKSDMAIWPVNFKEAGNDLPQVFAGRELRHHAAVFAMNLGLRRYHARKDSAAAGHDRRRRLVARRLNAQDQTLVQMFVCAHTHASIFTVAQNRYVSIGKMARPVVARHPQKT